ncbi:uncharacterized protein LOC143254091 isoform X2 [Tachypleus tridentatus]|uniref:uncharacterized protein LOC143254091 isoform X2 n=1 Tax=Tachypleus tridentatus TaxID=6853 RepID=UPI003FD5F663
MPMQEELLLTELHHPKYITNPCELLFVDSGTESAISFGPDWLRNLCTDPSIGSSTNSDIQGHENSDITNVLRFKKESWTNVKQELPVETFSSALQQRKLTVLQQNLIGPKIWRKENLKDDSSEDVMSEDKQLMSEILEHTLMEEDKKIVQPPRKMHRPTYIRPSTRKYSEFNHFGKFQTVWNQPFDELPVRTDDRIQTVEDSWTQGEGECSSDDEPDFWVVSKNFRFHRNTPWFTRQLSPIFSHGFRTHLDPLLEEYKEVFSDGESSTDSGVDVSTWSYCFPIHKGPQTLVSSYKHSSQSESCDGSSLDKDDSNYMTSEDSVDFTYLEKSTEDMMSRWIEEEDQRFRNMCVVRPESENCKATGTSLCTSVEDKVVYSDKNCSSEVNPPRVIKPPPGIPQPTSPPEIREQQLKHIQDQLLHKQLQEYQILYNSLQSQLKQDRTFQRLHFQQQHMVLHYFLVQQLLSLQFVPPINKDTSPEAVVSQSEKTTEPDKLYPDSNCYVTGRNKTKPDGVENFERTEKEKVVKHARLDVTRNPPRKERDPKKRIKRQNNRRTDERHLKKDKSRQSESDVEGLVEKKCLEKEQLQPKFDLKEFPKLIDLCKEKKAKNGTKLENVTTNDGSEKQTPAWGGKVTILEAPSLSEIQKIQEQKENEEKTKIKKLRQQLPQNQMPLLQNNKTPTWGQRPLTFLLEPVKTLTEIQKEEEEKLVMEKENYGQKHVTVTVHIPESDQEDKQNIKPWNKIRSYSENQENENAGISKNNRKTKNTLKLSCSAFPPLEKSNVTSQNKSGEEILEKETRGGNQTTQIADGTGGITYNISAHEKCRKEEPVEHDSFTSQGKLGRNTMPKRKKKILQKLDNSVLGFSFKLDSDRVCVGKGDKYEGEQETTVSFK